MLCPKCNSQNPEDSKFCSSCGASLVKSDRLHHIIAIIISLLIGGPISAVATHFIWKLKVSKKTKVILTIITIILINILSLIFLYAVGYNVLNSYLQQKQNYLPNIIENNPYK